MIIYKPVSKKSRAVQHFIECANDVSLRYDRAERERREEKARELAKVCTECLVKSDEMTVLGHYKESEDWNTRAQDAENEMRTLRCEFPAPREGCILYEKIFGDEDEYGFMNIPLDLRLRKFWITQGPANPLPWLLVTHERWKEMYSGSMSDEERLMCKCVTLSVAHDEGGKLDSADKRIYRHEPYQAHYFERDAFCKFLWEKLEDDKSRIERAYHDVKPYMDKWLNAQTPAAATQGSEAAEPAGKGAQGQTESERRAPPVQNLNITQNVKSIFANVQAENVQTGDHASINKQDETERKKKSVVGKVLEIISTVLGWLEPFKTFIYKIVLRK
jgi:hypothetical protein